MTEHDSTLAGRAEQLRRAFDQGFAERDAESAEATLELLLVRVRGQGYALRLEQVAGLHADRKLVPVPSPRPELLGLVGLRGQVAPVYDLGLLLGYGAAAGARWVALVQSSAPLAVAFQEFEAHARVPRAAVTTSGDAGAGQRFVTANVALADGVRPVIDLSALVAAVTQSRRHGAPEREERR